MRPELAIADSPGKLILFGEHSVAYGHPAVGMRLARGVKVWLRAGSGEVHTRLRPGITGAAAGIAPEALVHAALGDEAARFDVTIELALPPSAGLGTSAALAIALLRAKAAFDDVPLEGEALLERAIAVEHVAHGRSSGLDPSICMNPGLVEFTRSGAQASITSTPIESSFHVVVGVHGSHGGTAARVAEIAALHRSIPRLVDHVMGVLGECATEGARALLAGELARAGQVIDVAHGALSSLRLVSAGVEHGVRLARRAGALGAKMTGAGGSGGAYFALAPDVSTAMSVQAKLAEAGDFAWIETAPSS